MSDWTHTTRSLARSSASEEADVFPLSLVWGRGRNTTGRCAGLTRGTDPPGSWGGSHTLSVQQEKPRGIPGFPFRGHAQARTSAVSSSFFLAFLRSSLDST